jgi:hypothetical protein
MKEPAWANILCVLVVAVICLPLSLYMVYTAISGVGDVALV